MLVAVQLSVPGLYFPPVFTAPWTARITWTRDDSYQFFEYACQEGNEAIRNNILATRATRRKAAGAAP